MGAGVIEQPNILMLVTDHQLHYRHGWDGGARLLRPGFDRFASNATTFTRAYAVTPLCGPARRSLLNGLYPHNHRNIHNQSESAFAEDVYFRPLEAAGYENFYYGKWHAGPGTAKDFGCEGLCPSFYGNPYITPEYRTYLNELGIERGSHRVDTYFWNESSKAKFKTLFEGATDYFCEYDWCGEPCVGLTESTKESHESFFLSHLACRKLDEIASDPRQRPFHMRVDMWAPHQPYFPTQEYLDMYDPSEILEYGSFRDDLSDKPVCYRKMNRPIADESGNLIVPSIFPWEEWQRILAHAYAQTTMTDDAIIRIVDRLDEVGLADNTVVIWTSDHGDALASHGGMFDKGSFMTEEIVRIPLAIRLPNGQQARPIVDALVNTTDIVPTIMELSGTQLRNEADGTSLVPLCNGKGDQRETMLIESYGQGYRDKQRSRTLVTSRYKYTVYEEDICELYDLENDPYELNNLRDSCSVAGELDEALRDTIEEIGDTDGEEIYRNKQ